jgi:glycosyltransferase involved in cell wall biosynthesis
MSTKKEGGRRLHEGMLDTAPLISIITVIFRARDELYELLESVCGLKNRQIELIVVDGGSNDGTVDLLREYDLKIDYWISEPDQGIYDAMNKGIAAARGTFLLHLNAGDRLIYIPTEELEWAEAQNIDVAAFRVSIDQEDEFRPSCGIALMFNNTLHHQGTFFRRKTFVPYDTKYKVFADFDVNQRLALSGARMATFGQVVALHCTDGISSVQSDSAVSEFFAIIAKNYGRKCLPIAWFMCKLRGLNSRLGQLAR